MKGFNYAYHQRVGSEMGNWASSVGWMVCIYGGSWVCGVDLTTERNNTSLCIVCCAQEALSLPIFVRLWTSLPSSLCLSEGVRAVRRRARQEMCWTSSLRSSTTSLTPSRIQQASCAWCPETTCSTGMGIVAHHLAVPNCFNYLKLPPPKKKRSKPICLGKRIHGSRVWSVKGLFAIVSPVQKQHENPPY